MQAQDVMTAVVATIGSDATLQDAAKLMLEREVSALPVMDRKDRLIAQPPVRLALHPRPDCRRALARYSRLTRREP